MNPLLESALLGTVTLLLFVYGAGQRYLKKKITADIELERTKLANALSQYEEDLASVQTTLTQVRTQRIAEKAEYEALKRQKQELLEYLATEDGRVANQAALENLAIVREEVQVLIKQRDALNHLQGGKLLASASFVPKQKVYTTFCVLLAECERVWAFAPGTLLSIEGAHGAPRCSWTGSTPASLESFMDSIKDLEWVQHGAISLYADC